MSSTDEFAGPAIQLTDHDFVTIAMTLDLEPTIIRAVAEVESAGEGFLRSRKPKILFESYQFHKLTQGRYDLYPEISRPKWERDYLGGEREYERLGLALDFDRPNALKSASWGKFQIMGFNFIYCGFDDVEGFVQAHVKSEQEHLRAFLNYIKSLKLYEPLGRHDWATFARLYNGPGYAQNSYDVKLAKAYEKWRV